MSTWFAILTLSVVLNIDHVASTSSNSTRDGKLFSIFQVVTFPNGVCTGSSSRNGTCYRADECESRGGSSSGTCAQGFGVCCILILSCGSTSSENCTYLVQGTTTAPPIDPCTFTICKTSPNICRIRLDFTAFSIAGPALGTVVGAAAATNNGGAIGDCTTDSFSITSPGNMGSPVICGTNTDQHMIVDASDQCHRASFDFGGTGTTRQFDIKVTQYACGDENGGPDGCLQYFKGNTGTFSSFNFPTTATSVTDSVTHLSNQCYTMCFRQEPGKCAICFQPVIAGTGMTGDQGSFGLSLTSDATIAGTQDGGCSEDYLQIGGAEMDDGSFVVGSISAISHNRICGRFFSFSIAAGAVGGIVNTQSICTQQRPFRVIFKTDADEVTGAIAGANENEQEAFPGGIIGFHLNYALQDC
ncbi:uncharacterized protein LOC131885355 [Tigriopus californicus]|uniref:uncharacterized protein LOC131885355 n=1 Tax=Tigriopus californicus TaxID=6832 RepID=UPI0027D9DCB8|nr:uncharacterized protein LOC131885355 [Tigriopus californicus]XP_059089366.1 uncharacterized protein LOC131885355 [Tigriopus californicus]